MAHRIREGMREAHLPEPMGGEGKFVEADQTYVGGRVRPRHVPDVSAKTLKPLLVDAIATDTHFRTDQSPVYTEIGAGFGNIILDKPSR